MRNDINNQSALKRWNGSQRRIGLTGGIASGKSSIGAFLKITKNLPILDADIYAHEALEPGKPSTRIVLERYGNSIKIQKKGSQPSINRSALGEIIFNKPHERFWIEKLLHPIVKERLIKELEARKNEPIIVLIIPLLFEANLSELCSEVWVINCSAEQQMHRLLKRDGLSKNEAKKRIEAQWPIKTKLELADIIIDNSKRPKEWLGKVDKLC